MNKPNFSNKVLMLWVTINLLMSPLAFSVSDEEATYTSYFANSEVIKSSLFAQITPIYSGASIVHKLEEINSFAPPENIVQAENFPNNPLNFFYITFLISIIVFYLFSFYVMKWPSRNILIFLSFFGFIFIVGCDLLEGGRTDINPVLNVNITSAPSGNITNGVPFDISLKIECTGTGCDEYWGDNCYNGTLSFNLRREWDVNISNINDVSISSLISGSDKQITYTKRYCESFTEENPLVRITPHIGPFELMRNYTIYFNVSSDSPNVESITVNTTVTIVTNDADLNRELCHSPWAWNAEAGCCGDDNGDCGLLNDGKLCSWVWNTDASPAWNDISDNTGSIIEVGCSNISYSAVSDGTDVFACDNRMPLGINPSSSECILSLSNRTNAHIGNCDQYQNKLYCNPPYGYDLECNYRSRPCENNETEILRLSNRTDSHAAERGEDDYNGRICCKANKNGTIANILKPNGEHSTYLLTLSDENNAHAAYQPCKGNYETFITLSSDDPNITHFQCGVIGESTERSPQGSVLLSSLNSHLEIDEHEYLCQCNMEENASLFECCTEEDEEDCKSNDYNYLGDEWEADGITYYCISNNTWLGELEVSGRRYCEVIKLADNEYLFRSYRNLWTRDTNNRSHSSAIAWKNNSYDINNDGFVNAVDVELVINAALLPLPGGLDADVNSDGEVNAVDVQLVINAVLGMAECCRADQCWTGLECYEQQNSDADDPPFPRGQNGTFRCIDGNWTLSMAKYTWDRASKGYCPYPNQCLVNPNSTNGNHGNTSSFSQNYDDWAQNDIQCINNTQFIGDHYCEDGNWTSRTKLVALTLLDWMGDRQIFDYTLFCDDYKESINYYDYSTPFTGNLNDIFGRDGSNPSADSRIINNICVLRVKPETFTSERVIIGVALNKPVNANLGATGGTRQYNFLTLIQKRSDYCNGAIAESDGYNGCDSSAVWYNNNTMSIIFSNSSIIIGNRLFLFEWWDALMDYLLGREEEIEILEGFFSIFNYSYVNNTQNYNLIYIDRKENKKINGLIEKVAENPGEPETDFVTYMAIEYKNFTSNICDSIANYSRENIDITGDSGIMPIICNRDQNVIHVQTWTRAGQEPELSENQIAAWKELTAKLRVKKTQ